MASLPANANEIQLTAGAPGEANATRRACRRNNLFDKSKLVKQI
jgi:hypothetical protein